MKHSYSLRAWVLSILSLFLIPKIRAQDTTLTNLPCFYITTADSMPVVSKEDYVEGNLTVAGGLPADGYYSGAIEIRGRGNSTWSFPKKPYRIKLASKYNLLGMPAKAKSWVLLANYADKSLMRNALAFEASKFFGFAYTPAYRMVDVVLNGEYQGTYMVTDQIEVNPGRVNVVEQSETDTTLPAISGGYLIETGGGTAEDDIHYLTTRGMDMSVHDPDDDVINQQQISYINNYLQQYEDAMFSPNFKDTATGYRKFVDFKSLVDWYLLNEICANSDTYWSSYMYKQRNDPHFYMGPMWDYDIAFNNDYRVGDETYKYMRDWAYNSRIWMHQILQDENFYRATKARWIEVRKTGLIGRLQKVADSLSTLLDQSQRLNFKRWPILDTVVYLELGARGTYRKEVRFVKDFINSHAAWLNGEFVGLKGDNPYNIVSGESGKVWDILNGSKLDSAAVVQFTASGTTSQQWRAIPLNNGYYKIVNVKSGRVVSNGKSLQQETGLFQTKFVVGDSSQQWRIINTGSHYGIINRYSEQAADNFGSILSDNNRVTQFWQDIYGRVNQFYDFKTINTTAKPVEDTTAVAFSLYPNPTTSSTVTATVDLKENANVKLFIYNAQGLLVRQVDKGLLQKGKNAIPVSIIGLRSGNYTISVRAGNNAASQTLLVK